MTQSRFASADERIIEPMLALARCSKLERIIVASSKGIEPVFVLNAAVMVPGSLELNMTQGA